MSKPYAILREKMKPAVRRKAAEKTKTLLDAMPLQELRHARSLSQEQLAQTLSVKQAAVSKLEKRTDMYISTLRNFIKAMGGDLEIIAKFPDGSVQISQFEDIVAKIERVNSPSSG
ncbi:transcriptional regulator [Smithella sp. F21]|nr:transcriptional regulator [Smithella sp. F21]